MIDDHLNPIMPQLLADLGADFGVVSSHIVRFVSWMPYRLLIVFLIDEFGTLSAVDILLPFSVVHHLSVHLLGIHTSLKMRIGVGIALIDQSAVFSTFQNTRLYKLCRRRSSLHFDSRKNNTLRRSLFSHSLHSPTTTRHQHVRLGDRTSHPNCATLSSPWLRPQIQPRRTHMGLPLSRLSLYRRRSTHRQSCNR